MTPLSPSSSSSNTSIDLLAPIYAHTPKTSMTDVLRAADRYAYTGCGSTACCYLFYLGNDQILIDIRKPCRTSACLVRIAGPCPAEPFQLVPARLGLSPAGPYQLWCTNLRITTETRPTRNIRQWLGTVVGSPQPEDCLPT